MLALFENPFFVREYRLAWRRGFSPFQWVVASVSVAGGVLLFLLLGDAIAPAQAGRRAPSSAWWLLLPHLVMCLAAAGKSATRSIGTAAAGTPLELELLVSLGPAEWVLGKMTYPLVLTVIVWAAPIPVLLVAGVFGVVERQPLVDGLGVPLLLALASIPASFLPYDVQSAGGKPVVSPSAPFDGVNRWIGAMVLGWLWVAWLVTGFLALFSPFRMLYNVPVPAALPLGICCVAGALCGWYAGELTYLRSERSERRFQWLACAAWAVLYFVPLGMFWGWTHGWLRLVLLCAGPAFVALRRLTIGKVPAGKRARPRLTWLAIRELEWFERHWPNALTQLDLGRALRACSPLAALGGGVAIIAATVVPSVTVAARQPGMLTYAGFMVGVASLARLGSAMGAVRALWDADGKTGFLESLFLTPQTSGELAAGRIAAAAGSHGLNVLGISAAAAGFLGWEMGWRGGLPLWIFLAAPSIVAAAWCATGVAPVAPTRAFYGAEDIPVALLLFGIAPAELFAALAGYYGWLPAVWLWICRLMVLSASMAVARWLFRFRVEELDRLRGGLE